MAYADYLRCPGCDGKTIYLPDSDVPEDVETWHRKCLDAEMSKRAADAVIAANTASAAMTSGYACPDCTCCNNCTGPGKDCRWSESLGHYTCPCTGG
jgi:hypothetical protein